MSVQSVSAQRWFNSSSLEFGLIGGFSHYNGDLVKTAIEPRAMKPSFGIITRYSPQQRFTVRLSAQYGQIEGTGPPVIMLRPRSCAISMALIC